MEIAEQKKAGVETGISSKENKTEKLERFQDAELKRLLSQTS